MIVRALSIFAVAGLLSATLAALPAKAQSDAERRISRLEQTVKTLQSIIFQGQATGQPVVVKPEGADPEVAGLRQRLDDLEVSRRGDVGQAESLSRDLQDAARNRTADRAAADAQIKALNDRIARLETQLAAAVAAQQAAAAQAQAQAFATGPEAELPAAPPPPGSARARLGADATARAQAGDTGVLGTLPGRPAAAAPVSDEAGAYRDARALLTSGDYAAATAAFQDYVARYPEAARAPEAYYWLGETYYLREAYRQSTGAYAAALKSKPKTTWAPDAMVRLGESLVQTNQNAQACAAADEFEKTYAARASAAAKTRAASVRRRAKCA